MDHNLVQDYYNNQPFKKENVDDKVTLTAAELIIDGKRELIYRTGLFAQKNTADAVVIEGELHTNKL